MLSFNIFETQNKKKNIYTENPSCNWFSTLISEVSSKLYYRKFSISFISAKTAAMISTEQKPSLSLNR